MQPASQLYPPAPWIPEGSLTDKRIPGIIRAYLILLDSFPVDACGVPPGMGCCDCGRVSCVPTGSPDQDIVCTSFNEWEDDDEDEDLSRCGAIIDVSCWINCMPLLCGWCIARRLLAGNLKCPCGCGRYWRFLDHDYNGTETQCVCHPDMEVPICAACFHKRRFVDRSFCCPHCTVEMDPNANDGTVMQQPLQANGPSPSFDSMDEDESPVTRLSKRDRME